MDICKTGAEHIRSLQDGRAVYIDGELVPDVTTHSAFRNSVASPQAFMTIRPRRRISSA